MKFSFQVWTYPENMGDGSACVRMFATKEQAEKYRKKQIKDCGDDWAEDCISQRTMEFDADGRLTNPDRA
jgi:hypothetical protein